MASPFDFSSFLLTPPIPNTHSAGGAVASESGRDDQLGLSYGADSNTLDVPRASAVPSTSPQHGAGPPGHSLFQQRDVGQLGQDNSTHGQSQQMHLQFNQDARSHNDGIAQQGGVETQQESPNRPSAPQGSTDRASTFDERDYGLDPSAFSNVAFAMPSFLAASSAPGQFGDGPSMVDPSAFHAQQSTSKQAQQLQGFAVPSDNRQPPNEGERTAMHVQIPSATAQSKQKYVPDTHNPVYGIYGSSVISVNPDVSPFKMAPNSVQQAVLNAGYNAQALESRGTTPDFDPKSLGLPVGDQLFPQPLPGLYSSSGFDMLGVLARVVARPNPQINIGPVDTSCSFLVVDARRYDLPIVFASETFSKLTGYTNADIIGRNCRFLQAPDGRVAMGSRRKYTDGNAAWHLRTHVASGKECQASIINYRKDGSPFINLVTIIPITWDTDEIAYFVGFQVDLVEQPNAILEKMRNGTYVVNYSLLPTNPAPIPTAPLAPQEPLEETHLPPDADPWSEQKPVKANAVTVSADATAAASQSSMTIAPELLEAMGQVDNGEHLDDDAAKKKWNKMLLDHTGDFVHVLSLKGSFLYVSPSVKNMLEYEPADLIGKTLQSVCHPSDIVPVMRELKEASTVTHPIINLLYRFRRKRSGYVWMEAQGKLYLEQSKSRKCVILVGRERPVYKLSWDDLRAAGGLGEKEYWSKISPDGMFLYNTPSIKTVLGYEASNLQGTSLFELIDNARASELTKALQDVAAGNSVRLHYKLRNSKGAYVDVITNFFSDVQPKSPSTKSVAGVVHPSIIAQTNEYTSEMRRRATSKQIGSLPRPHGVNSPAAVSASRPDYVRASSSATRDMIITSADVTHDSGSNSDDSGKGHSRSGGSGSESRSGSSSGSQAPSGSDSSAASTFSAIPSTYKILMQNGSTQSDNLFDELDTTRTTSWQYELHQLKLTNKKLKEELHMLQAAKRKRKKREELRSRLEASGSPAPQPVAANPSAKTCANCGRTDSPEWRVGPSGARNLCNACGLRWAKATRNQRQMSGTPASATPTSSSASEMDTTGSTYQHSGMNGPFIAMPRPPLQHAQSSQFQQSGH